jgi:uncharacterized protein (TIGR03437 family)
MGGVIALLAGSGSGQTFPALTNASIQGTYFFRHLQFTTDTSSNVIDSRAALGTIAFDGAGHYTLNGFQTVTNLAPVNLVVNGIYALGAAGVMTLTNPQRTNFLMNGRAGTEAILASTTETGDNTFDLFAAIPAPTAVQSLGSFFGNYYIASLELPGGGGTAVRSALTAVTSGGNGVFNCIVTGHAAGVNNGAVSTQGNSGLDYAIAPDGSGTIDFGSSSNNLNGTKNLYVSQSGNVILSGSLVAGSQDFLIGVRAYAGTPGGTSISGLFWQGGLRLDQAHASTQAYAGSLNGFSTLGRVVFADRLHQIGISPGYDFTGENDIAVNPAGTFPNGTLAIGFDLLGVGANGSTLVDADLNAFDATGFSIDVAIQAPSLTGTGVYLNPQGIVNAASLAPAGQSISGGEFVSLFGSGMAAQQMAASPPYPLTLGGVTVTVNGTAAPVYFVSSGQVNFVVPYGATGGSAALVVTNNGVASNSVTVPLQKTSPGIFSVDGSGTGDGTVTHASGGLVNAKNPAKKGETVTIYVAGLGLVTPQPADGVPGTGNPVSTINAPVTVTIGGQAATVVFAGLAPGFPGLYQLNVTIPATLSGSGSLPLALETADTFTDQVNIEVR